MVEKPLVCLAGSVYFNSCTSGRKEGKSDGMRNLLK